MDEARVGGSTEPPADAPAPAIGSLVADRYRVEGLLGQGGMAVVHRALDELSGRQVALKRLRESAMQHQGLFEREYYTLAQLAHPRIIQVLDYGMEDGAPYYTMELLQGQDLHAARLKEGRDVCDVCRWLRDVASALALLHSRRFVHRDVSARNVWLSTDGRAKLIDFGGLMPMGPADRMVGTPPFIAPEAAYGLPLDGRADLYSLGSLAYLLLTGRHAYPARAVADLRYYWQRRPPRPHDLVPELPRALSDFVMMLLSLDERGRPSTAAEVVERLTAIAELEPDDSVQVAHAYLTTPNMVGRTAQVVAFRKRLLRALRGSGSAALIAAAPGAGRSRLLSGLLLEAKVMGVVAVQASGEDSGLGGTSLLASLAEGLLNSTAEAAKAASDLIPTLSTLSPRVRAELGAAAGRRLDSSRLRALGPAFVEWVTRIARRCPLLLAVDDVHHADDEAQRVLAELASGVSKSRLVLALSAERSSLSAERPVLQSLVRSCDSVELPPLTADDLAHLLGSLFGSVPHLEPAVQWLQELSGGSPGHCMQYVQYLVDAGVIRYQAGEWHLPARLREQPLPESLDGLLDARVRSLGDDARRLALGLCLTHDDTRPDWQPQTQLRSEHFGELIGVEDRGRVFAAVAELVRSGMLVERGGEYLLSQRVMNHALLRCTTEEERRSMHLRLAKVLFEGGYCDPHLAILHTRRGGDDVLALSRARSISFGWPDVAHDWRQTRITISIQNAEHLLGVIQQQRLGSPRDEVKIRSGLLLSSTVNDWSLSRHGAAQLRRLSQDTGLAYWDETNASLPPLERLFACFGRAQQTYDATPEDDRGLAPAEAVRELAASVMALGSSYANAFELEELASLPAKLAPLRPLSPAIEVLGAINEFTVARAQGREHERFAGLIAALDADQQLPEPVRGGATVVLLFLHSVHAARLGRPGAGDIARQIEERFYPGTWMVDYACWLEAGFQGDARGMAQHAPRAHTTVDDDLWRWRALLHVEVELHALTNDVLGLKRLLESLGALAERFAGWVPILQCARAELHRMRGELRQARSELEHALLLAPPGQHLAYTLASSAYARVLLEQGALGELREHAQASIAAAVREELRTTLIADNAIALALGESRAGNHEAAEAAVSQAFEAAGRARMGGLRMAALQEGRARVALAAERRTEVIAATDELRALVIGGGMASWLARYEALVADARLEGEAELGGSAERSAALDQTVAELSPSFGQCSGDAERALRALEAVVSEASAIGGHLYFVSDGSPLLVASLSDNHPSEQVSRFVAQYLEAETGACDTATVTSMDVASVASEGVVTTTLDGRAYVPVILASGEAGDDPVGLALLEVGGRAFRRPEYAFVRALCLALKGQAA